MVADRELRDKAEARGGYDLQSPATVTYSTSQVHLSLIVLPSGEQV